LSTRRTLFESIDDDRGPLAHRMRPRTLEDLLGQEHLIGPGKPLRLAIERGEIFSCVFWGPPGCGKTTLAKLLAHHTDKAFEIFSAVTEGVPRVRELIREARDRRDMEQRGTILFCDEIHRFNKAQQDAFLPSVEEGVITLVGATTENPSFELNSALLSRMRVFVLNPIDDESIAAIIGRAWSRLCEEADLEATLAKDALALLVRHAGGDARKSLNTLEAVWDHCFSASADRPATLTADTIVDVLERRLPRYDKDGEEHYNLISALHKAVRGSDVEGALYWFARMMEGGEDPLYVARRVVRIAAEDIGLADPRALTVALAAKDAYAFLGSPEGELAIVEALIFLATAPKSNRTYEAWNQAQAAARSHPDEPVPMHIRNAPTKLLDELGYGKGYRYDHAEGGRAAGQEYLPPALRGSRWYEPTDAGFEKNITERLQWWAEHKKTITR
jgi:putative ATPase